MSLQQLKCPTSSRNDGRLHFGTAADIKSESVAGLRRISHVVFTVPTPIAEIAFQNTAIVYGILFKAAAETLRTIAADPKHLGAQIGLVAVLHTWGQNLHHHPHVHCVVPGGGLSVDGQRWVACRPGFFLPVRVLSRLFRRLFLERLQSAFDAGQLRFFSDLAGLADADVFTARLAELGHPH